MQGYFVVFTYLWIALLNITVIRSLKKVKVFWIGHAIIIVVICVYSIIITWNSTGGAPWPWWFVAIYLMFPVYLSLLFGSVMLSRYKKNDI